MGIASLIRLQPHLHLTGETGEMNRVCSLVAREKPHVVLLDMHLADADGLEKLFAQLRQASPNVRILALASTDNEQMLMSIIRLGVSGVFWKHQPAANLLKAIDAVASGEHWFERSITRLILQATHDQPANTAGKTSNAISPFSARENCVACLATYGYPAKKIADKINLSEKTVRNYLTNIYEKSLVANQIELCLKLSPLSFCGPEQPYKQGDCPYKKG